MCLHKNKSPVDEIMLNGILSVQVAPLMLYVSTSMSASVAFTRPTKMGFMFPLPSPDTSLTKRVIGPCITGGLSLTFARMIVTVAVTTCESSAMSVALSKAVILNTMVGDPVS